MNSPTKAPPPSAPVWVPADILRIVDTAIDVCNDRDRPAMAEDLEAVRLYVEQASAALAQQPAVTLADIRRTAGYWKERAAILQQRIDALEAQQPAAVDGAAERLAEAVKGEPGWSSLNPQARIGKARRYLALATQHQEPKS